MEIKAKNLEAGQVIEIKGKRYTIDQVVAKDTEIKSKVTGVVLTYTEENGDESTTEHRVFLNGSSAVKVVPPTLGSRMRDAFWRKLGR